MQLCGELSCWASMAAMRGARTSVLLAVCALSGMPVATNAAAMGLQSARTTHQASTMRTDSCLPKDEIEAVLGQAGSLLEQARYPDAIVLLESVSKARCDPRIDLLLAGAEEGSGNTAKATETLAAAHADWPANTSIAASMAREYMNAGQLDKAVSALSGFHPTTTTPLQEMQVGAAAYLAAHRLDEAQAVAETAYKGYPSLQTLLLLANVLQLQGRYKEVNRLLADHRKLYAESPAFLITAAESESDAMLYAAARTDLEHAIALDNTSYQAHYLLGTVMIAQDQAPAAEEEYRKAIQLAPDQPRTYYQLALLLRNRQDELGEEPLLAQALAADAHYAPAYCERGRILLDQQRIQDAVAQLSLAIDYNPQLEQAYYLLARAYSRLGQKDKAEATVRRFTALRAANRKKSPDTHQGQLAAELSNQ